MLYPEISEDELAVQDRLTWYVGAAVPVPVRASVVVVVCALLVTLNVPLAAPVVVGLKVMVNGTL